MLSYSETKVRQLIRSGELAAIGKGRGLRVVTASVVAYTQRGDEWQIVKMIYQIVISST